MNPRARWIIPRNVCELLADPTVMPPDDFVEYWAAGRLNLRSELVRP
jgi:hypothetical protein